ncbi:MAG: hypothetical protein CSA97_04695 [Bacteroidetes bacterium]|nr:MAG: hypothetical protein CSA97_04695 [Bacteroidota bacterium]
MDFVAIDFETANEAAYSACSIALVLVQQGQIVHSYYRLCRPEPNRYTYHCTQVHGLNRTDTDSEPTFAELWPEIYPLIDGKLLVAHNAPFDFRVLKAATIQFNLPQPNLRYFCTKQMARKATRLQDITLYNYRLPTVAAHYGYQEFDHHHALADAQACAHIFLGIQNQLGITSESQLGATLGCPAKTLEQTTCNF